MLSAIPNSRHWLRAFFGGNHVNIDVAAIAHEPAQQIRPEKTEPRVPQRFPHYDLRNIVLSGDTQQCFSNIPARRRNHFRSELARQSDIASQPRLFVLRKWP